MLEYVIPTLINFDMTLFQLKICINIVILNLFV